MRKDDVLERVKDESLGHLDEVANLNNEFRDENVKKSVQDIQMENNKMKEEILSFCKSGKNCKEVE